MLKKTRFITFYSYKGGVGRSLALANIAYLLAYQGHKALIIDLDLEAPGQHKTDLFHSAFKNSIRPPKGVMDLLSDYKSYREDLRNAKDCQKDKPYSWQALNDYLIRSNVFDDKVARLSQTEIPDSLEQQNQFQQGSIWLMPATGQQGENLTSYQKQLADWDWNDFYDNDAGAAFFHALKFQLRRLEFDDVLIDSRTGYSDIFYTSTLIFADSVVCLSGLNRQNIEGTEQAVNTLVDPKNTGVYGEKRILLVATPVPDTLRENELNARLRNISDEWEALKNRQWDARIPYDPYLGLSEEVLALNTANPWQTTNRYVNAMVGLLDVLGEKPNTSSVEDFTAVEKINPFPAIRVEYWKEFEVVNHFVDPGNNIRSALEQFMPTVVFGSRGTGKTMLARWFDYETTAYRLENEHKIPGPDTINQIGLWFRLDIDLLNAFNCAEDEPRENYNLLFGQFLDLLFLRKALRAMQRLGGIHKWLEEKRLYRLLSREMNVNPVSEYKEFEDVIEKFLWEIRAYINNPGSQSLPFIIQSNILLKVLVEVLRENSSFRQKNHYFIILIDEYENFHEYQQKIVNTRLKQAKESDRITFKLLVRNDGIHTYETLADGQPLELTHDLRHYNLDEGIGFDQFKRHIKEIVSKHLQESGYFTSRQRISPDDIFAELEITNEVNQLIGNRGTKPLSEWVVKQYPKNIYEPLISWMDTEQSVLRQAVVVVLLNQGKSLDSLLAEFKEDTQKAKDWYHNYHVGALYWLHSLYKKPKIYAGFNYIVGIAGNNTRVALDLCYTIIEAWLAEGEKRVLPISIKIQNQAIHTQSETYFRKLLGKGSDSNQIYRFVGRLGRLFEIIHKGPRQGEPEINHFKIEDEVMPEIQPLLSQCRTEAILRWLPGNKQKSLADAQKDAWQLHPRYAPYFNISWRRKKSLSLTGNEVHTLFMGEEKAWKALVRKIEERYRRTEVSVRSGKSVQNELKL